MKTLRVTDYARQWFQQKLQAGRIAKDYNPAYFDGGCIEVIEETVRIPFTSGE